MKNKNMAENQKENELENLKKKMFDYEEIDGDIMAIPKSKDYNDYIQLGRLQGSLSKQKDVLKIINDLEPTTLGEKLMLEELKQRIEKHGRK